MKKNDIKAIALALGISTASLLFTGCGINDEYEANVIFSSILDDIKDNTCLDEILAEEENKELVTQMFILEKCLTMSERLNSLKLNKHKDKNSEPLNIDDCIGMLDVWESYIEELEHLSPKDEKYKSIMKELKNAEGEVNKWLYNNGYKTIISVASLVSKAKLVDCFSLDKSEYKNFSILENPGKFNSNSGVIKIKYIDPNSKSEYYYNVPDNSGDDSYIADDFYTICSETKLAQMIFVVNSSKKLDSKLKPKDKVTYNEELNKTLIYYTGIIKSSMYASFTVGNDGINQVTDNKDVNTAYTKKASSYIGQQKN